MKVLYLSYFAEPTTFEKICEAGLDPSVARQNYDEALLKNLLSGEILPQEDVEIVSYLPYNSQLGEVPLEEEYLGKKLSYVWTKRSNPFTILKAMKRVKKLVNAWIKRTEGEERIILTYAANPILLAPVISKRKKVKFVTVCSEVPQYRNMTEGNKIVNGLKKKIFTHYNEKMSGYIYMSKFMDEVCNAHQAPWIVVEGMTSIPPLGEKFSKTEERIFYAGGLHKENGIDLLLDAVVQLNEKGRKLVLQLCGKGNEEERVAEYADKYEYIQFFGSLPNQEVRALEKSATVLINPRKPDHMLTKYSFPSKTFEYFSSGTAALLTRLDGIPEEFYEYCYTCSVDSTEQLAQDIEAVLSVPLEEREAKAAQAYEFLVREKSAMAQTKRIVQFLKEVI